MATNNTIIRQAWPDLNSISPQQIGVSTVTDVVLGYRMWGGKDSVGALTYFLAKDKPGQLTTLSLTGPTTNNGSAGILQYSASGQVTGGGGINALADVVVSTPINNHVLVYNESTAKWENGDAPDGSVTLDTAYNNFQINDAFVTIDGVEGQGPLVYKPTGGIAFEIDLDAFTSFGSAGFSVTYGDDSFEWRVHSANNLSVWANTRDWDINAAEGISLDAASASNFTVSGATEDLTFGARANTITLNDAANLVYAGSAASLIGALNENRTAIANHTIDAAYNSSAGAALVTVDDGSITWNLLNDSSFLIDLAGSTVDERFDVFIDTGTYSGLYIRRQDASNVALGADLYSWNVDLVNGFSFDAGSTSSLNVSGGPLTLRTHTDGGNIWIKTEATGEFAKDINLDSSGAIDIQAAGGIDLDAVAASRFVVSGATADLTLGARAATITLNSATDTALSGFTKTSFIGALNELKAHVGSAFTPGSVIFAGASGNLTQDNANLFFNDTTKQLRVGATSGIGHLVVQGGGHITNPVIEAVISGASDSLWAMIQMAANMPVNGVLLHFIGRSRDIGNSGYFAFNYKGPASADNYISFGLYDINDVLCVTGAANVGVGLSSPAARLHVVKDAIFDVSSVTTTGTDGVKINNGADYWRFLRGGADLLSVSAALSSFSLEASSTSSLNVSGGNLDLRTHTDGGNVQLKTEGTGGVAKDIYLDSNGIVDVQAVTTISLGAANITADTSSGISLDAATASNFTVSGATADLTLGARAATITLNSATDTTLSGFTKTSLIGALNELKAHVGSSFTTGSVIFAGASGNLTQDNANLFFNDTRNSLSIGGTTFDGTASKVLQIVGSTAPAAAVTDGVQIYAKDSSLGAGHTTIGFYTEEVVETGAFVASHKFRVFINGTEYWISLDSVA